MSSASATAWENWDFVREGPNFWTDLDKDVVNYDDMPTSVAETELAEYLIMLKLSGVLSAQQACVLAFWMKSSGCTGPVTEFGLRPDAQTGKFQERWDLKMGTLPRDVDAYSLPMIRRLRSDASRTLAPVAVIPPHESLCREIANTRDELEASYR